VSLGRVLDPADPDELGRGTIIHRYMEHHDVGPRFSGYREFIAAVPHGSATHLDALSHISWKGQMYNGVPSSSLTTTAGATKLSVHEVVAGITSRGVLLDIPAAKGVDWLESGQAVVPADLEVAEERQDVRVGEGDALLLYTGNSERMAVHGLPDDHSASGYSAACLPWLHERGVALLSSDGINDVQPSGFDSVDLPLPVHTVGIVAMGLWLVDNMLLSELSRACARQKRWEFFFTMSTLRFVGSTSSLVNPVAIF
jgi:kynurenine formamidase